MQPRPSLRQPSIALARGNRPFGWDYSVGQLDEERLRRLPDAAALERPRVGHGSVPDEIQQARFGKLVR